MVVVEADGREALAVAGEVAGADAALVLALQDRRRLQRLRVPHVDSRVAPHLPDRNVCVMCRKHDITPERTWHTRVLQTKVRGEFMRVQFTCKTSILTMHMKLPVVLYINSKRRPVKNHIQNVAIHELPTVSEELYQ